MSLVSRLAGFGLCILGAFATGYAEGVNSISTSVYPLVEKAAGSIPGLAPTITNLMKTYMEQEALPPLNSYLALGLALTAGGFILIMLGDRKLRGPKAEMPPPSQPAR